MLDGQEVHLGTHQQIGEMLNQAQEEVGRKGGLGISSGGGLLDMNGECGRDEVIT